MAWILWRNPISSDKKSGVFIWEMKQWGEEGSGIITSIFCIFYESRGLCQRFITFLAESQSRN
ncbi:MAG: hypothetical protein A2Z51_01225 [Deltaproteobacteria bacterium RBG_19FT_COMBO_52_11]|nr:MAG: hypothetical protein A2Z51_01225 [Deltaproteobacteria bacterium RBG_19FT_COMBO_52_11]